MTDPNDELFGDVMETSSIEAAAEYPAVVVGEPYDGAVIGRPGAAEAPDAIRQALASVKTHHFEAGPVGRLADVGNLPIARETVAETQDAIAEQVAPLYASFPVFLGGDNACTVGNVTPLLDDATGVISFDAHLDCRAGEPSSGTPYRQLRDRGLDALAVVGARHFETSTPYAEYLDEWGTVVTAEAVGRDSEDALDTAFDALDGVERIFLSLDCDVLDASAAPGVSAPTPGGLTTRELFSLLHEAASDPRVAGFEVVECAPPLDREEMTVRAAARAVAHVLAGVSR
ncbi:formimidoylglutamase [Natronomonas sp. EA1]|uniref:formimidoylglutamase n=1 Tax=Natronomonas sp. EA1 TaxID=3421655 RepID=UPI003EBCF2EC